MARPWLAACALQATCPDCTKILPQWVQVARDLQDRKDLVLLTVADPQGLAPSPYEHDENPAVFFARPRAGAAAGAEAAAGAGLPDLSARLLAELARHEREGARAQLEVVRSKYLLRLGPQAAGSEPLAVLAARFLDGQAPPASAAPARRPFGLARASMLRRASEVLLRYGADPGGHDAALRRRGNARWYTTWYRNRGTLAAEERPARDEVEKDVHARLMHKVREGWRWWNWQKFKRQRRRRDVAPMQGVECDEARVKLAREAARDGAGTRMHVMCGSFLSPLAAKAAGGEKFDEACRCVCPGCDADLPDQDHIMWGCACRPSWAPDRPRDELQVRWGWPAGRSCEEDRLILRWMEEVAERTWDARCPARQWQAPRGAARTNPPGDEEADDLLEEEAELQRQQGEDPEGPRARAVPLWSALVAAGAPVTPRYVSLPRFKAAAEPDESRRFFHEHGFAVFRAASAGDVSRAEGLFWDYVEGLGTGVDRSRPQTWTDERWPTTRTHNGLLAFFGIGQSEFLWYLRSLPEVRAAFAALWGSDDLLASFDGATALRFQDPSLHVSHDYWWHVDQNPRSQPASDCLQGVLQLTAASPDTGGLVLVPGSHRLYPQLYEERYGDMLDAANPEHLHFGIPPWDPPVQRHLSESAVQPALEAGDLVVWNSTTLHCSFVGAGFGAPRGRNRTRRPLARLAAYVAMSPRSKAPEEVLRL
ncbi:unnamed protein product, partial [Prorocentrum cordatum]